jgi:hypothetical protein
MRLFAGLSRRSPIGTLMADAPYDFAIFGSTPLAALLAGLLATVHGKRVCLVGDASSAFRLPRSADLSVMSVTRPETWALLKETTPEVVKLLGKIRARAGMARVDPLFIAETAAGADGLAHMRHVALANGYAIERLADGAGKGGIAYQLRDAVLLRRAELEPVLAGWLEKSGVGQLSRPDVVATVRRDGTARLDFHGSTAEAAHAVLADDAAILQHVAAAERDRTLLLEPATAMLTEPTRPLAAPAMLYVDRRVTLMRGRQGGIIALGAGRPQEAIARIGGCLAGRGPLRRAGQRVFRTVGTVDGAPLIGTARGVRATVLAGLGVSGAFLAPALARLIAGAASEREKAYFSAREAGRGNARALVAEFVGGEAVA